ncbi:MAG: hypothetical protein ACKPB3_01410, partial [Bacteroidota bacterium]
MIVELLLLNGAFVSMFYYKHGAFQNPFPSLLLYVNFAWVVSVALTRAYDIKRSSGLFSIIRGTASALILHMLFVFGFYVFQQEFRYSRELLLWFYSTGFASIMLYRIVFHLSIRHF